jgi:hypothetical protein
MFIATTNIILWITLKTMYLSDSSVITKAEQIMKRAKANKKCNLCFVPQ